MLLGDAIRKRINDLAIERNITLHMVATKAGITHSTLNALINENSNDPKTSTILHICEGLDIELWEFYKHPVFKDVKAE